MEAAEEIQRVRTDAEREAFKQGHTQIKNVRSLIYRLEYLQKKIRVHIAAGNAGVQGINRGVGDMILRETKATAWAIKLAGETVDAGPKFLTEIATALEGHAVFLEEIPTQANAANDEIEPRDATVSV